MLSSSIQKLHTKFQPNWLKNIKVMQVFHFQAGRLVGWQVGLAGQHAQMHINHIHMLSPSIQRLHTKFQPNRLKNGKVMQVFHFQAGRLVGPVGVVRSQKLDRMQSALPYYNFLPNMNQIVKALKSYSFFKMNTTTMTMTTTTPAWFILQRFSASWGKNSKTRFGFPRQYFTRSF